MIVGQFLMLDFNILAKVTSIATDGSFFDFDCCNGHWSGKYHIASKSLFDTDGNLAIKADVAIVSTVQPPYGVGKRLGHGDTAGYYNEAIPYMMKGFEHVNV